jgi:uncharacterized membrane protein
MLSPAHTDYVPDVVLSQQLLLSTAVVLLPITGWLPSAAWQQ